MPGFALGKHRWEGADGKHLPDICLAGSILPVSSGELKPAGMGIQKTWGQPGLWVRRCQVSEEAALPLILWKGLSFGVFPSASQMEKSW